MLNLYILGLIKQIDLLEFIMELVLFGAEKIWFHLRYLIGVKSGVTYAISYNYAKIKVDLYDSLPLEFLQLLFYFLLLNFKLP